MVVLQTPNTQHNQPPRAGAALVAKPKLICFTLGDSPVGRLLLAGTAHGVCMVCLADNDATLQRALRAEFPNAELVRDDTALRLWWTALLANLHGQRPQSQLPYDIAGTSFQHQVWQALCKIPPGCTRSYTEIAVALGHPKGARAVARACATNPVALVIPCHRVIRGNGELAGYRWGLERKRALLAAEQR